MIILLLAILAVAVVGILIDQYITRSVSAESQWPIRTIVAVVFIIILILLLVKVLARAGVTLP